MLSLGSAVQPFSVEEEMGLGFGDGGDDMDGDIEAGRHYLPTPTQGCYEGVRAVQHMK